MKTVNFPLETAKSFYNSGNSESRQFALDNYSKEELEEKELPKTWKELGMVKGYYVSDYSNLYTTNCFTNVNNKNTFPTKELAEASIALAQLLQLRDFYNDGWIPIYGFNTERKYSIHVSDGVIFKDDFVSYQKVMAFKSAKLRDEFFTNFKDLLEIAKPLL